jgi:hypothetical protein
VQSTRILIARKPKNLLKAASQRNIIKNDLQPNLIASIYILYPGALHLKNFNDHFLLSILRHAVAGFHPGLFYGFANIINFNGMIEFSNYKLMSFS